MVRKSCFQWYCFVTGLLCFLLAGNVWAGRGGKMDFSFGRLGINVPPKTMPCKGKIVPTPASIELKDGKLVIKNSH